MPAVRNRHRTNIALSEHIEKLLEAANSASQTVAALHVAFMAFAAYFGVIIWGTTHEDLLRNSPIKLPILDVELPLTSFYGCVPWLLVLLHFNLLIQLELLSRKLWNLDRDLPNTPSGQQVRDQLFIFPFTHFIAGRSTFPVRGLLSLVVSLTVIVLPLFILMAAQIRFLPFHDEVITWSQRVAVWTNVLILLVLWPVIASPNDKGRESWKNLVFLLFGYWFVFLRYWLIVIWNKLRLLICRYPPRLRWNQIGSRHISYIQAKGMFFLMLSTLAVLPLSIVALIPGRITTNNYQRSIEKIEPTDNGFFQGEGGFHHTIAVDVYLPIKDTTWYLEDLLINWAPQSLLSVLDDSYYPVTSRRCIPLEDTKKSGRVMLRWTCKFFEVNGFLRNLIVKESVLVSKNTSMSILNRAIDLDKEIRDSAFKEFEGINLQGRDLRFSDFSKSIMPKANMSNAKLEGVQFVNTMLQGANLRQTQLNNSNLGAAYLQDVDLSGSELKTSGFLKANLQGANLQESNMQGTVFIEADLQSAFIYSAELQAVDLTGSNLKNADLENADLQGSKLENVNLQGTNLENANLEGVNLKNTNLYGVSKWTEKLFGVFIDNSGYDENEKKNNRNFLFKGIGSCQLYCYSENPEFLYCDNNKKEQLDEYKSVLYPYLIELACSDSAIAEGIASRALLNIDEEDIIYNPDFGLAEALVRELDELKPCTGLAGLSKETRQRLQEEAARQQTPTPQQAPEI